MNMLRMFKQPITILAIECPGTYRHNAATASPYR